MPRSSKGDGNSSPGTWPTLRSKSFPLTAASANAYNAVLQFSKMAIACEGYRVASGTGHHQKSFEAVKAALGKAGEPLVDYVEMCWRKHNHIDYGASEVVTEAEEAEEIIGKAREFQEMVEEWIAKRHPCFKA